MALENYKKKMADNAAIKIYNKYYKRYSARVKAHTILEKDFKKWKYQAMIKIGIGSIKKQTGEFSLLDTQTFQRFLSLSLFGTK